MKLDGSKVQALLPAAMIPFVMPMTTLAAEGTGRVSYNNFILQRLV